MPIITLLKRFLPLVRDAISAELPYIFSPNTGLNGFLSRGLVNTAFPIVERFLLDLLRPWYLKLYGVTSNFDWANSFLKTSSPFFVIGIAGLYTVLIMLCTFGTFSLILGTGEFYPFYRWISLRLSCFCSRSSYLSLFWNDSLSFSLLSTLG